MVVEFYDSADANGPLACVLAFHGGDNPSEAATTLTDFFTELSSLSDPRFEDAGLLAARFIAWEGQKGSRRKSFDFSDVTIIPPHQSHSYQVVRIYAGLESQPHLELVKDRYTTAEEMDEARGIIAQACKDGR